MLNAVGVMGDDVVAEFHDLEEAGSVAICKSCN